MKTELYQSRLARLQKLIQLQAPSQIIVAEMLITMVAVKDSYWRVLIFVFHQWRDHLWYDRVQRPLAMLRCRAWCWWHHRTPEAYWDLQEIKSEQDYPLDQRAGADEDEKIN